MKTKIKAHGFALWELLIIIVVLLVVGGIGAYVWNKKNEQKTAPASSKTETTQSVPKESDKTATYFTVKEWGVRAPYDDASDFIYTLDKDGNIAEVKSKKLLAMRAGCEYGDGGIGILSRVLPSEPAPYSEDGHYTVEDWAKDSPDYVKKVGNYYYIDTPPQQTCAAANTKNYEEISKVAEQKANDLKALIKKLEAVN